MKFDAQGEQIKPPPFPEWRVRLVPILTNGIT